MYVYYNNIVMRSDTFEPQNDTSGPRRFVTLPQEVTLAFLAVNFIINCKKLCTKHV